MMHNNINTLNSKYNYNKESINSLTDKVSNESLIKINPTTN